jgi:Threonyl and Alanyl tRNA synthetase second additional domain
LPSSLKEIRIVEIEGFDKTPCKDPHVENTSEIGYLKILRVKKVGKDRYRFVPRSKIRKVKGCQTSNPFLVYSLLVGKCLLFCFLMIIIDMATIAAIATAAIA